MSAEKLQQLLARLGPNPTEVHVDFETQGVDSHNHECDVVVWGLATGAGAVAFDARCLSPSAARLLMDWCLAPERQWIAFNSVFDASWLYDWLGQCQWPNFTGCTLMLYRLLTSEGHYGQRYGLEQAQTAVLGWPTDSQKTWLSEVLRRHELKKGEMWRLADLEPENFAKYCAVDAVASYELWEYFKWRCLESEQAGTALGDALRTTWNYHRQLQVPQLERVVRRQHLGVRVNRSQFGKYLGQLQAERCKVVQSLSTHPLLVEYVTEYERAKEATWRRKGTKVTKVKAKFKDKPWLPENQAACGWVRDTVRLPKTKWEHEHGTWCQLTEKFKPSKPAPERFNWGSQKQLSEMLYQSVFTVTHVEPDWTKTPAGRKVPPHAIVDIQGVLRSIPLTKGGAIPVSKEVYSWLGDIGKLLKQLSEIDQKLGYLKAYLAGSKHDGRLHLKLRPGATANGRAAGG